MERYKCFNELQRDTTVIPTFVPNNFILLISKDCTDLFIVIAKLSITLKLDTK